MSSSELDTAADRIRHCIESSADDLVEVQENGDGAPIAWTIQRGSMIATVHYAEEHTCYQAVFPYSVIDDIQDILTVEDAQNVLRNYGESLDGIGDEEVQRRAAEHILDNTPEEILNDFANDLIQLLSHPSMSFQFYMTDAGTISGFQVEHSLFPGADDFRYRDYDEAVQSVITIGHAAMSYARQCLDVESAVDMHTTSAPPRYIQ